MRLTFLFAILFLFGGLQSTAKILRVGLTGITPILNVDFTNFYAAYNSASSGDTIYVFSGTLAGNGWPTSNQRPEISKRLVIVSKGNWLDSTATPKGNSGLQAAKGTATLGNGGQDLVFYPGSKGSVVMGFNCEGRDIFILEDSITIKRNYNCRINLFNLSVKNLTVEGNYRVWFTGNDNIANVYSNVIIRNNFIYQLQLPLKTYTGLIANNTMAYDGTNSANGGLTVMSFWNGGSATYVDLALGSWIFENNLLISYFSANAGNNSNWYLILNGQNSILNYNVALQSNSVSNWPGTGTGNVYLNPANVNSIFEGFPAIGIRSADNRYILKAGSPANQANRPGSLADAGMYGGLFPYKLSNIPAIPTIYGISSPQGNTVTGSTIQINISTRSNN